YGGAVLQPADALEMSGVKYVVAVEYVSKGKLANPYAGAAKQQQTYTRGALAAASKQAAAFQHVARIRQRHERAEASALARSQRAEQKQQATLLRDAKKRAAEQKRTEAKHERYAKHGL